MAAGWGSNAWGQTGWGKSLYDAPAAETLAFGDSLTQRLLWERIDDSQTPNWTSVDDAQNPGWVLVNTRP